MTPRRRLTLENLEARDCPSVYQLAGALILQEGGPGQHALSVTPTATPGTVNYSDDGATGTASGVTAIYEVASSGRLYNGTTIPAGMFTEGGNSVLFSKAAKSTLVGYGAGDLIQDTAGGSSIQSFAGNAVIYGGRGDTIVAEGDQNLVYDTLPTTVTTYIMLGTHAKDYIFSGTGGVVTGLNANDVTASFDFV